MSIELHMFLLFKIMTIHRVKKLQIILCVENFPTLKRSEIFDALNVRRNANFSEFAQLIFFLRKLMR